jgi:hypothetical protein
MTDTEAMTDDRAETLDGRAKDPSLPLLRGGEIAGE